MSLYLPDYPLPKSETKAEGEVVELRLTGAFYTYFGWFPWSDFEGESFSEEKVSQLTGGRIGTVAVTAESHGGESTKNRP